MNLINNSMESEPQDFSWKAFVKGTFSDVDGHWSCKRAITGTGMALFVIAFFATTFWGFKVDPAIMNVLDTIILSGLAVTASERFGKSFPGTEPTDPINTK